MKNRYFLPILPIFLLFVILTCQKETVEQVKDPVTVEGEGVKINVEQKVIDLSSAVVSEIEAVDTFEYNGVIFPKYELVIEATQEEIDEIQPGTVIYVPTGAIGGKLLFVYEVGESKKSSSQLKGMFGLEIKAFQATLDMYFNYENAEIEFSTPDNRSKINYDYQHKLVGSELPLADVEIKFEFEHDKKFKLEFSSSPQALCKLDIYGKLWESGASYITAEGSLTIHPAIDLFIRYEPVISGTGFLEWLEAAAVPDYLLMLYKDKNYFLGNMQQLRTLVYTDIDREMTFNLHLSGGIDLDEPYSIPLGSLYIPSAPVSAGFELAFEIDFSLIGDLELEYYKKEYYDLVLGVNLHRDLPEPEWIYSFNEETESGFNLKARVELTTGIYLVLETEIYVLGILGPELRAKTFMEATAAFTASAGTNDPFEMDWKLTADAGVKAGASLNLSLFHIDKATLKFYSLAEKTWSKNIYLAPARLAIEQGNNQTGIMGQPLPGPITVGAYDSRNELIKYLPVPLYFETNNGSVDPSYMTLTSDGLASVIWTLDSENETQELKVQFKDGGEKKEEVTIYATAINSGSNGGDGDWPRDTQTQVVEVTNPVTGKTWMDRNLGASRAATSSTDSEAYGDLYQWGRAADGHEKRNSPITSTLSSSDTPGHGSFILAPNLPYDWRSPQNANLWQGVSGINNPCPAGFRLPTKAELDAERQSWSSNNKEGAFASPLKLPVAGYRYHGDLPLFMVGSLGFYWSGTVDSGGSRRLDFHYILASTNSYNRAFGYSVRCIKD